MVQRTHNSRLEHSFRRLLHPTALTLLGRGIINHWEAMWWTIDWITHQPHESGHLSEQEADRVMTLLCIWKHC